MLNIITYSTLYPNAATPVHGVFVENRLRHLVDTGKVSARVVAPVPWFPFGHRLFGHYGEFARCPAEETRHGLRITHPRYPVIPKLSTPFHASLLERWSRPAVAAILQQNPDIDLIDSHYFYPDGVAAVRMAKSFDKPVVITARGTDLSLLADDPKVRPQIKWAAEQADGLITVCEALKDKLVELGIPADKVRVLRNGVDLSLFHPVDRDAARTALGLTGRILVSVGLLIPRKAHDLTISAMPQMPEAQLLIAGDGPERGRLEQQARGLGVESRVHFLGRVPHDRLKELYSAADAMILSSSREGWANVLLESMACGTPVIASDVWGTKEVVTSQAGGVLMKSRTTDGLVDAYHRLFASLPTRAETRRYAELFSWDDTTAGQLELFRDVLRSA